MQRWAAPACVSTRARPGAAWAGVSAVASVALAIPVVLLVAGLHKQVPARAEAPTKRPIKVVRVTKVVRPVTVKRIVEQTPAAAGVRAGAAAGRAGPRAAAHDGDSRRTTAPSWDRTAPVQRQTAPKDQAEPAPDSAPPLTRRSAAEPPIRPLAVG